MPHERLLLIDGEKYPTFEQWDAAGQPTANKFPEFYGIPPKIRYGIPKPGMDQDIVPLDESIGSNYFTRLQEDLHEVIWSGGATNNNDVFVIISKLLLAKIYDEKETYPGEEYRFQRLGGIDAPESVIELRDRMNDLYDLAEKSYLALEKRSSAPAFDNTKISAEKIAYVVGRLEGVSVTKNQHSGDMLGQFFENIISQDFTQSKGQFFTPFKIVQFMLELCDVTGIAEEVLHSEVKSWEVVYLPSAETMRVTPDQGPSRA